MTGEQAEGWIGFGALTTAAVYGYRYLSEGPTPAPTTGARNHLARAVGAGPILKPGSWVILWGFEWTVLAVMAKVAPAPAGGFAALIVVSTLLANITPIIKDLNTNRKSTEKGA